jgi:hypothetical protein
MRSPEAPDRGPDCGLSLERTVRRESLRVGGKYTTICQRLADDSCKIARDISNSNNPPLAGR